MKVSGSTVLVSGGSSGLGGACVRLLATAGANVIIADLNQEAGDKLAADFAPRVRFARTDVTDEKSVQGRSIWRSSRLAGCRFPFSAPASRSPKSCSASPGRTAWRASPR